VLRAGLLSADMSTVIHALPEKGEVERDLHLRYWYGTVRPAEGDWDDEDEDSVDGVGLGPVVCWCGGRHITLSSGVLAVWHLGSWDDRSL
jgi:hypothetical protein